MMLCVARQLAASLEKQFAPQKVDAIFRGLPPVEPAPQTEDVCVCALQMELRTFHSPERWIRKLDNTLDLAVRQGSRIVCLPEFYAMTPLLCHRLVHLAVKGAALLPSGAGGTDTELSVAPLLKAFSFLMPVYEEIICRFAKRYGIWLYGGSGFVLEKDTVFNRGFLATPEGRIAARQDKIHLTKEEMDMGISAGDTLQVIPTPIGNIALSVCMDATYFETFRIAKAKGADYIIVPIGDMAEFDPWLALRGAQMRVNETGLAAIKPALVTSPDFPVTFSGKAGIYFPMATCLESAECSHPRKEDMVIRRFSLAALRNRKSELFQRDNPEFDRHYIEELIKSTHFPQTDH